MKNVVLFATAWAVLTACGEDDPVVRDVFVPTNNATNNANNQATNNATNNQATNNANNQSTNNATNTFDSMSIVCTRPASDYAPGLDDAWDACISDDGTYHPFEPSISTASRVAAFEQIANLLWRTGVPTGQDFTDAYELFAPGEGLLSRVSRREDEHLPPVTDGMGNVLSCGDEGVPELDPQRCVGPALMQPILTTAFQQGITGNNPEYNAATIEATLLWFLHVSVYKEATTCANTKKDCDSSYAYYTGDQPIRTAIGLAGYVNAASVKAHETMWDALLGVRCWRDLDQTDVAENTTLQAQALEQLDRATYHAIARIVDARIQRMALETGAQKAASFRFIQLLGASLLREAERRDVALKATLEAEFANLSRFDETEARTALYLLFPCP